MNNNTPTIREILECLDVQGLVSQKEMMKIEESLNKSDQISKDPIYIHILLGFGAWFATLSFISFCYISRIFKDDFLTTITGIIFLVVAIFITKINKAIFFSQLSLALAFSGNILIVAGIIENFHPHELSVAVIIQAIICVIVYPFYNNAIYRFVAPAALVVLITTWIIEEKAFFLIHLLIAAETFLVGTLLFYRKRPHLLTPLLYSSAIMLPITLLFMNISQVDIWRKNFDEPLWPSSILLAGSLIYLYLHLAGGLK
ncbi:DUF4401 domain-containing protein [Candidatus Desantisbacteria bacterium]|nr:DUF4401 domain-containing protein [Candidatus Desantisbacteria bacterium]